MNKNQGLFITLEGIEGVGKTTQVDYLGEIFRRSGREVTITREPGGTSVGEAIREILLNGKDLDICDETELLLLFAARAQHLQRVILPALQGGQVVICDRFTDASLAYQGGGRGIAVKRIYELVDWLSCSMKPDLTLLLDAPVELGLARAGKRGELDRFESETIAFFEAIRRAYLGIAEKEPERMVVLDASMDLEQVQEQIDEVIKLKELV